MYQAWQVEYASLKYPDIEIDPGKQARVMEIDGEIEVLDKKLRKLELERKAKIFQGWRKATEEPQLENN